MSLVNSSIDSISSDVTLATSKPKIQGNDDKLLANDGGLDTRITSIENGVYGDLYAYDNAVATTLTTQNTWYQFTEYTNVGVSNGTTPSTANDEILCPTAGKYVVSFNISFSGTGNAVIEAAAFKNNGATQFTNVHIERKLGTGGDIGPASGSGIVDVSANDTIEIWVRCTSTGGVSVTMKDVNLNVIKVGD